MDETVYKWFFIVWAVGIVLTWPPLIWRRVRQMRAKGLPIMPKVPPDALYGERTASGHADGWRQFGGGSNCVLVAVTPAELWVTAFFPFNFIAGFWGMEHRVPKQQVLGAEVDRGLFGNARVELRDHKGEVRRLRLKLRDPDAFVAALRQ